MITLNQIIKSVINSEHGWAVAEQFEDTFNGELFEEQNINALNYIKNCLKWNIMENNVFNDAAMEEIKEYYDNLVEYLEEAKQ
jgi:hypothetical protein